MRGLGELIDRWAGLERPLRRLPPTAAVAALILIAAAVAWSALALARPASGPVTDGRAVVEATAGFGDLDLYEAIDDRVQRGEPYYAAALAEQRAHGYPTRPFVTVRTPIIAWGMRQWGATGWRVIAFVLLAMNALAWTARLSPRTVPVERVAVALLVVAGGLAVFNARYVVVHDLFAGLLVSLALAFRRPGHWGPSWIAAAAGLAIRELALPFVVLWAALALAERRWREFAAVAVLLALFAAGMAFHAEAVESARLAGDRTSLGWSEMIGPRMVLASLAELTPLLAVPPALAGALALLPLVGWLGLGGRTGLFATLWFAGFALAVSLFARSGNFYWVLLMLPAYGAGLALAPRALVDLIAAALGRTRPA
jgi:hypothetical protein